MEAAVFGLTLASRRRESSWSRSRRAKGVRRFGTGAVELPREHAEATVMWAELLEYEIRVDDEGHDRYGAFRVGAYDDLVTALGLARLVDP